ncbi:MAG: RNA polymerase factor sigma-54 [Bacteroidia bacterium]|nr:RNA polymerase factor sigma-54 [Bacteroidia bacterium]
MLKQSLSQKLLQKLSPQQIQLMKMLQLPTIALEQRIKEELEANPALEEGEEAEDEINNEEDEIIADDAADGENEEAGVEEDFSVEDYMDEDEGESYKLKTNNVGPDDERKEIPITSSITLQEILENQLGLQSLDNHQYQVALYLIGNIDDDGYLRRDLASVVDDIAFSQNITTTEEELNEMLHIIQQFDPPGVGARNLQECLLLQLLRKDQKQEVVQLAIKVVQTQMAEFSKKHYDKMGKNLAISEVRLKEVVHEILKLNPKPGNSGSDSQKSIQEIIPDFMLFNNDGTFELSLNSRNQPELRISKDYRNMLDDYSKEKNKQSKEASSFVRQKIESAKWFIDSIRQRENTLMATMRAIMEYQFDYFLEGDETKLKPMILKDIADRTGLDISTISRVTNSKYVQTQFGTLPLKSFFSESLSTDTGEEVSSKEVKKILQDNIAVEDKKKPLTDDALTKLLTKKGYNIARRTVAKYRELLGIPVARMRKEL